MDSLDLGNSVGGKLKPGDNPNSRRAKVPKDIRPMNKPRGEKPDPVLKWVDPDETPSSSTLGSFTETFDDEFQVEVGLRSDFFKPVVEASQLLTTMLATESGIAQDTASKAAEFLLPLARCKIVKRLYATATDGEKSELLKLKGLYYDTTGVPEPIYLATSIAGSFDSKLGRVHIKHLTDYALRQATSAINELHDIDDQVFRVKIDDPDTLFWDTDGSLQHLQEELTAEIRAHTFQARINGKDVTVAPPPRGRRDWATYKASLTDENDPHSYVRDRCAIMELVSPKRMTQAALNAVGRRLATGNARKEAIGQYLSETFLPFYAKRYMRIIERFYQTKDVSSQYGGSPAQLTINSDDYTGTQMLPQSDASLALGWVFSPSDSVEFHTARSVAERTGKNKDRVISAIEQVGSRKDL